ncbi:EF-hand [Anaeromyces robustus]|uniref:EF-hand n=1 Tax=Anaeromyces robustus TaxID=1754192 RepID=A0A1Y1WC96_9FUNG|nr:EF-hand [Anaeromyces robustus]|eukprot:ORX71005.1 EF-hand [Anaeromyces robustus]
MAQIPLSQMVFEKYDTDKSGGISYAEFKAMAYDLGYYISDMELKLAVKNLDKSGSGSIIYDDFKKWWMDKDRWNNVKLSEENFKYLYEISSQFQKFDKDKGGSIDKKEFKDFWKEVTKKKKVKSSEEKEMFKKLDTDGDGTISFNEFVDYLIEKYNGDLAKYFE